MDGSTFFVVWFFPPSREQKLRPTRIRDNIMNKTIKFVLLIVSAFAFITLASCSKDKDEKKEATIPSSLSGTSWKCLVGVQLQWFNQDANCTIKYISDNACELYYSSEADEIGEMKTTGTYTYNSSTGHVEFQDFDASDIIPGCNFIDGNAYVNVSVVLMDVNIGVSGNNTKLTFNKQ